MCGTDPAAIGGYPLPLLPTLSCDIYAIDSREALPCLMSSMKNAFIRALNHVYAISIRFPSSDQRILYFLQYVKSVVDLLQVHLEGDRLFYTTCSDGRPLTEALRPDCYPNFSGATEALTTLAGVLAEWIKVKRITLSTTAPSQSSTYRLLTHTQQVFYRSIYNSASPWCLACKPRSVRLTLIVTTLRVAAGEISDFRVYICHHFGR